MVAKKTPAKKAVKAPAKKTPGQEDSSQEGRGGPRQEDSRRPQCPGTGQEGCAAEEGPSGPKEGGAAAEAGQSRTPTRQRSIASTWNVYRRRRGADREGVRRRPAEGVRRRPAAVGEIYPAPSALRQALSSSRNRNRASQTPIRTNELKRAHP